MAGGSDTVGVIGVGMIGASLAMALRRNGYEGALYGYDPSGVGECATPTDSPGALCEASDIIVLATPLGQFAECARQLAKVWTDDKVLTDVGSVKQAVVDAVRGAFGRVPPSFIPGHPIAGSEKSTAAAALDDLFAGATVVLTPDAGSDESALNKVRGMWERVGATVECMDCETHDRVFSEVSHLPHMAAYALVNCLLADDSEEMRRFAGGGFREYARLASSSPEMWRDISVANRQRLVRAVRRYTDEMKNVGDMLESGDAKVLYDYFARARRARDAGPRRG